MVGNLTGCRYYYKSGEPIPVQMQERFGGDFTTDVTRGQKTVEFTDQGQAKVVAMLGEGTLYLAVPASSRCIPTFP